jgi:hypothetical protein
MARQAITLRRDGAHRGKILPFVRHFQAYNKVSRAAQPPGGATGKNEAAFGETRPQGQPAVGSGEIRRLHGRSTGTRDICHVSPTKCTPRGSCIVFCRSHCAISTRMSGSAISKPKRAIRPAFQY